MDPGDADDDLERRLRAVRSGDADAFEGIVLRYQRPIRGWIAGRCPPGGDADDVAQRTFIEAFKRIDDYRPGASFQAWLFSIARYQLMSECTRLRRIADYHTRYAQKSLADELQRRIESSGSEFSPRLEQLERCLGEVRGQARQLLNWRYADELSLGEMARRTERSVGAIKKSLFRIRQQLHDCVESKLAEAAR